MRLKFASYNIHKAVGLDGRRDADRIISVLRELDADVIALQECDRRIGARQTVLPRVLLDDTSWQVAPVARRPRSIGWHGNALLVRRDIAIVSAQPLALPTLEPRGAICADLKTAAGNLVRVFGMHLDLSGLRRSDQIHALLSYCAEDEDVPTVMMGDFNQWGRTTGAMRLFGDQWRVLTSGASFPSRRPIAPLDRIVHSLHWRCSDTRVHRSALAASASDHLPIAATLDLEG